MGFNEVSWAAQSLELSFIALPATPVPAPPFPECLI